MAVKKLVSGRLVFVVVRAKRMPALDCVRRDLRVPCVMFDSNITVEVDMDQYVSRDQFAVVLLGAVCLVLIGCLSAGVALLGLI